MTLERCAVAVLILTLAGCAVDPVARRTEPIVGGSLEDGLPAVVAVGGGCSGTLIRERTVLTAAHCVQDGEPSDLEVLFGSDPSEPDARVRVIDAERHPEFDLSNPRDPVHDVALLTLAEAAPYPPASIDWARTSASDETLWVGFGATGTGDPRRKRSVELTVAGVGPQWFFVDNADEHGACGGDSGGAVMRDVDGEHRLVGVIQGSSEECGDGSVAMRLDPNRAFIEAAPPDGCSVARGRGSRRTPWGVAGMIVTLVCVARRRRTT